MRICKGYEEPVIGRYMWSTKWSKSTPLKRAQHISRISFITIADYTSPMSGEKKSTSRHWTANYEAARFSQPPQWWPIIFQAQKRSPGAEWQDTLCMDTNSLCFSVCFSKEYTRQSVRNPIQTVENSDELVASCIIVPWKAKCSSDD